MPPAKEAPRFSRAALYGDGLYGDRPYPEMVAPATGAGSVSEVT
jgi:hypothetical protein